MLFCNELLTHNNSSLADILNYLDLIIFGQHCIISFKNCITFVRNLNFSKGGLGDSL